MSSAPLQRQELLEVLQGVGREHSAAVVMFHAIIADLLGLGPGDHKALDMVARHAPVSAGELSRYTGLSSAAVTGLVDRLERAGMVERRRDPADRRRVLLEPSERFRRLGGRLFEGFAAAWQDLLDEYGDRELELILEFLRRSTELLRCETLRLAQAPDGGHDTPSSGAAHPADGGAGGT